MPIDPEIFSAPSEQPPPIRDTDIFKEPPQAKETSAPAPKPPQMSPSDVRQAILKDALAHGWGSGLPKFMYELGGKVTDYTGSPFLGAATSVIPDALQSILTGNVTAAAAKPVVEPVSRFLMRSALKPTLDQVRKGRAAPAVETMLKDGEGGLFSMPGYNPTAGGVEKMKAMVSDLADKVRNEIATSGATIPTSAVADYVPTAYPRFANGPQATQAIQDLGNVQEQFLNHPNVMGAQQIPIQVAQDMKTGYQKAISDKGYGELKNATTEGEKQIARGLRELIGEARPGIKEPLAREASIINALKMAERRVAVDANKNPIGLGWVGQPWMIPFWLWDRSALGKSLVARALSSGNYPALTGATAGALYQSQPQQ